MRLILGLGLRVLSSRIGNLEDDVTRTATSQVLAASCDFSENDIQTSPTQDDISLRAYCDALNTAIAVFGP